MPKDEKSTTGKEPVVVLGASRAGTVRIGWGATGARDTVDQAVIGTFANLREAIAGIQAVAQGAEPQVSPFDETLERWVVETAVATFCVYPLAAFLRTTDGKFISVHRADPHLVDVPRL